MSALLAPTVDVRRAADRYATRLGWLDSAHSFSFGRHYDSANTAYGQLLVNNDDVVQPGGGFPTHRHRNLEIVTWVLQGALVHRDSAGHSGVIHPGLAQRMSAGAGILHSERNDADDGGPVHFVQMWVVPDEPDLPPGYEQLEVGADLVGGGLLTVASGLARHEGAAATRIANRHAALHAARLQPGQAVQLPEAPYLHVFLARGEADLEGAGALGAGDAVRLTASGGRRVTAMSPAELLVWEMHAGPAG